MINLISRVVIAVLVKAEGPDGNVNGGRMHCKG